MSDCLFCKIAGGEIPSNKVYEDDLCYAFYDIDPQAPTHFLVIPKAHIPSVAAVDASNAPVVAHIFTVIAKVTRDALMVSYEDDYPGYHLAESKGYGSAEHIAAIRAHGLTPIHRVSFCGNFLETPCLF